MYSLLDKSVTGSDIYNIKKIDEIKSTFQQREQIVVDLFNTGKQSLTLAEIQRLTGYKQRFSAKRLAMHIANNNTDKM